MMRYKRALKDERGYDMLISVAVPYPVHWGVAWARTSKNPVASVWVADCGDPYVGNTIDSFRKPFYFTYVEKWMFRKVDFISIPIASAKPAYFPEFWPKIRVIPQGVNFEELQRERMPYRENAVVTFAYAGSFIPGHRDPSSLLRFLDSLSVDFKFIIYTNMPSLIMEAITIPHQRIEIREYAPRRVLIQELSTMDFLINIENSTQLMAPSKLIDYFLAGRPVLSLDGNRIDKEKILQFINRDFSGAMPMESYTQFDITQVTHSFLELI